MKEKINPIDAVLPHISAAVAEWQTVNSAENIGKRVKKLLDSESQQVTMKLLGFNTSWGREWELDHCNGRGGESAAGDFIRKAQQTAIQEWLAAIPLPTISTKLMASLKREMNDVYEHSILEQVRNMAKKRANEDIENLLSKVIPSQQLTNYIKAMELINPSGNHD